MTNYMSEFVRAQRRGNQLTNNGAPRGLFAAYIDASGAQNQTASFVYAGGSRSIPIPMPYDGANSWIRVIPEDGSLVLAGYRADINETVCINYLNPSPANKLNAYNSGLNLYRPLVPGELELNSSGAAQSYYSVRPVLDQRAGVVRSWLDSDKVESGQKAPVHTRQLWEYKSIPLAPLPDATTIPPTLYLLGDEERFGAVRRPYLMNPVSGAAARTIAIAKTNEALVAAQASVPPQPQLVAQYETLLAELAAPTTLLYSANYFSYPFPNFTLPTGIASPATLAPIQQAAAAAEFPVASAAGQFEPRVFAKEYVRIINNPLFAIAKNYPTLAVANPALVTATAALLNPRLIDIREGQVFDDLGNQTLSLHGAYLRAQYKYFTPAGDATTMTVDEVGNISWQGSAVASFGWDVNLISPTASISLACPNTFAVTTGFEISLTTLGFCGIQAGAAGIDASTDGNMSFTTGLAFSHDVLGGNYELSVDGNYSADTTMNIDLTAAADLTATATSGSLALVAPLIDIGGEKATQKVVNGDFLAAWLSALCDVLLAAAPTGNLGTPVPFASSTVPDTTTGAPFAAALAQLRVLLNSEDIETRAPILSETVSVQP